MARRRYVNENECGFFKDVSECEIISVEVDAPKLFRVLMSSNIL